jgi:hypothetical protein
MYHIQYFRGGVLMYRSLLLVTCLTLIALLSLSGYARCEDELAFEAEDADIISPPMVIVEDDDVSGGAYIKSPSGRAGWAEYEIEILELAQYFMWGMIQTQDGVTDSFFITFDLNDRGEDDDVNENTWDIDAPDLAWAWDPVSGRGAGGDPRIFELEEGTHMLRVWTRENETWLDCLFMSTNRNAIPVLASEFDGRERTGLIKKAVSYSGKLATAWARIKTQNY